MGFMFSYVLLINWIKKISKLFTTPEKYVNVSINYVRKKFPLLYSQSRRMSLKIPNQIYPCIHFKLLWRFKFIL